MREFILGAMIICSTFILKFAIEKDDYYRHAYEEVKGENEWYERKLNCYYETLPNLSGEALKNQVDFCRSFQIGSTP